MRCRRLYGGGRDNRSCDVSVRMYRSGKRESKTCSMSTTMTLLAAVRSASQHVGGNQGYLNKLPHKPHDAREHESRQARWVGIIKRD